MPPRRRPAARLLTPAGWAGLVAVTALVAALAAFVTGGLISR
jgi:hypothetical protein